MAKQGAHRLARRSRQSARRRPGMDWKRVALWSAAIGIVAVLGYFAIQLANPESSVDADTLTLAEGNAGSNVEALTGSTHTVYHSSAPLPDANSPQPDGKPTLVWFSGTWCEFCHSMEPFAHSVMSQFREEAVSSRSRSTTTAAPPHGTASAVLQPLCSSTRVAESSPVLGTSRRQTSLQPGLRRP